MDTETNPQDPTQQDQSTVTPPPEKRYVLEFEAEPKADDKPKTEAKPASDTDAVRDGLAKAGGIFSFLKREAPKPGEKPADGEAKPKTDEPKPKAEAKPKADAKLKADAGEKPKEGEGEPKPTPADLRAEKILGKKPKKAEAAEPEPKSEEPKGLTPEAVADVAARTAAEVVKRTTPTPDSKPKQDEDYPEDFKENAAVFDYMARSNPKKYGQIKQQLQTFHTKEQAYRSAWEAQNQGEEFDPEASEHASFYQKHTPAIDERDMEVAEKAVEDEEINAKVDARVQERLNTVVQPMLQNQAEQKIAPVIMQTRQRLAAAAFSAVLPKVDLKNLNPDLAKKIEEESPRQAEIINSTAARVGDIADTYTRITSGLIQVDQSNPVHADVIDTVARVQAFVLSRPRAERVRTTPDGRSVDFVPIERYAAMPQAERSKHWTIGPEEVTRQLEIDAAEMAQSAWSKERELMKRYGAKFEDEDETTPPVREASQATVPKTTPQNPPRQEIKTSRGMSEKGGAGQGSETVTIDPNGSFAALMRSIRPGRSVR